MLKNVKVPMPTKKVYFITRGKQNVCYVYYILRAYRNSKGQPTSEALLIGKKDEDSGKLIPNDNYFTIFDCKITVEYKGLIK